eukprot:m51a1_g14179 hypothetical protein (312) ;mRNA; f:50712-51835
MRYSRNRRRRLLKRCLTAALLVASLVYALRLLGPGEAEEPLHFAWRAPSGPVYFPEPPSALDAARALPGVDHVYVVGLERRPDRRSRMGVLMGFLGIPYEYVLATDGRVVERLIAQGKLSELDYPGIKFNISQQLRSMHKKDGPAGIGCLHTGLRVLLDIASKDWVALVLEDDVDFEIDIANRTKYIMSHAPSDWDIIRFGHCLEKRGQHVGGPFHRSTRLWCTHAMAFNGAKAANKLLSYINRPVLERAVWDKMLDIAVLEKHVAVSYSVWPPVVVQTLNQKGDIPTSGPKKMQKLDRSATEQLKSILDV